MKGLDVGMLFGEGVDDFARPVRRPVIDRNNRQTVCWIVDFEQRLHNVGDNRFFIVGGDQNCDLGPRRALQINVGMTLPAEEAVEREVIMAELYRYR